MNKFLQGLALFGLSIAALFFRLFVMMKLWGYILVPMGVPQLTLAQAYGVAIFINLASDSYSDTPKRSSEDTLQGIVNRFIYSLIAWGMGYWVCG